MDKKIKNPEIRFKGYIEDWKQEELGKFLTERKEMQKISEDAPILAFASGQGVIDRSERKSNNRDHLTLDQENKIYKLTELNDIVYNPSNLKYGAIDRNKHGRGVISPIYITFTTEEEPSFMELIVKSEKFKLRALQYEEGTVVKRQSVNPENLLSLKVNVAPSLQEQKNIGIFFQNLDNLITLNQKKYDKLVILKKAMLVKMFPKNGALVPEIRFKGFTEDWEVKRLGDIAQIKRGLTYSPIDVVNKGIKVLRSSNILEDTFVQKEDDVYVNEKAINIDFAKENDILITSANGSSRLVGKHAILKNLNIKAVHGGFMLIARTKLPYFLNASMSSPWYRKFINMNMAGGNGAIGNLKSSDLEEHNILTPHEDEQQKIGKYFQNLDNQIDLHKTQLDKLNTIKKACFSKMFVAQD